MLIFEVQFALGQRNFHRLRAQAYLKQGNLPQALADASHAVTIDPSNAEAHSIRAQIYQALGDDAEYQQDMAMYQKLRAPPPKKE